MTAKELQTIARLEERTLNMKTEITEIKGKVDKLNEKIDKVLEEIRNDREDHDKFITKRAGQWLVGTGIAITAIAISIINSIKAH